MIIGRRRRRAAPVAAVLLGVMTVILLSSGAYLMVVWNLPADSGDRPVAVTIPGGSSLLTASKILHEAGVIRSVRSFILLGKIRGLSDSIQAGELMFSTGMTPNEALDTLTRGRAVTYPVTIPEGYNLRQIAALLEEKGLADRGKFLSLAMDGAFARSLGVPADTLEGFLFPDTYHLPKGLSAERIIRRMVQRYRSVFTDEMRERARRLGMSELEVVTLASIIEKETGAPEERSRVSAVFHNRLRKGYRLQTDPTVIYGIENFDGNLTREDLRRDHPYNTYTRNGLPPGPIASPGEASIRAALYPADVPYLYFVSRGDGTHVFSSTLVEHNRAVRIYQKGGRP